MPTYLYYAAGAVAILILVSIFVWHRGQTPSDAIWNGIAEAIPQLQRRAVRNILPLQPPGGARDFQPQRAAAQTRRVADTIRLVYTVEQHEHGFLHAVSSQLVRRKSRKFHVHCALVVMLVLERQLTDSGITKEDVAFNVDQSDLGTFYVYMLLSPEQHQQFLGHMKMSA